MPRLTGAQVFSWAVLGFAIVVGGLGSWDGQIPLSREQVQQDEVLDALGLDLRFARRSIQDYAVIQVSLSLFFLGVLAISTQSVVGLSLRLGCGVGAAASLFVGVVGMLAIVPSTWQDLGGLLVQPESAPAIRVPIAVLVAEALLLLFFLAVRVREARPAGDAESRWRVRSFFLEVVLAVVALVCFYAIKNVLARWAGFTVGGLRTSVLPEGRDFSFFEPALAIVAFVVAFTLSHVLAVGIGQSGSSPLAPPLVMPLVALLVAAAVNVGNWRDVLPAGLASAFGLAGESLLWRLSVGALVGIGGGLGTCSVFEAGCALLRGTSEAVLGRRRFSVFVMSFCVVFALGYSLAGFVVGRGGGSHGLKVLVVRTKEPKPVAVLGITGTQLLQVGRFLGRACLFCGWAVNAEAAGTAELRYSCDGGQRAMVLQAEQGRVVGRVVPRSGREVRGLGGCAVLPGSWRESFPGARKEAADAANSLARGELPTFDLFCGNAKDAFVLAVHWWGRRACRPRSELFFFSRTGGWLQVPPPPVAELWWCRPEPNGVTIIARGACTTQAWNMFGRDLLLFATGSGEPPKLVACLNEAVLKSAGLDAAWEVADVSPEGRHWLFRYRFDTVRRSKYVLVNLDSGRAMTLPFRAAVAFFVPETLGGPLAAQYGQVDLRVP